MGKHNTVFFVAWRYLMARKRHSAVNLITAVAAAGVMVATMALVCVLSVLNGFEETVVQAFGLFDPELKIEPSEGEMLNTDTIVLQKALENDNIEAVTMTLVQQGLAMYDGVQMPVTVMGVDDSFGKVVVIDSLMMGGAWRIESEGSYATVSVGVTSKLSILSDYVNPIELYVPRRGVRVNVARPDNAFRKGYIYATGNFAVQQENHDAATIMMPLDMMQMLYGREPNEVSAIWLKLKNANNIRKTERALQQQLGTHFKVLNQKEQQHDYYRIMKIEKWITFLILVFILLIAVCNIIGSLSMLLIDKKDDIATLHALGADSQMVFRIFAVEGWLISMVGAVTGVIAGIALCLLQQRYGLIRMSTEVFAPSYPVAIRWTDVLTVFATVLVLGALAAQYPARMLKRNDLTAKE